MGSVHSPMEIDVNQALKIVNEIFLSPLPLERNHYNLRDIEERVYYLMYKLLNSSKVCLH